MKILVTGATGWVGQAAVQALLARGDQVVAVARQPSAALSHPHLQWHVISGLDGSTPWGCALDGVDAVLHLAARVHVMRETADDPLAQFRRVNTEATQHLAHAAAAAGVRRFLLVSTVKVHGEATAPGRPFTETSPLQPLDAYGQSKQEAEQALIAVCQTNGGMQYTVVRPPLVYGPGVKANFRALWRAVQRGWPLPLGALDNRRSLVALDNLVDLLVTCCRHPAAENQVFLVSDGEDVSTAALVRAMAQAQGRTARLLPVPAPWLLGIGRLLGREAALQRLCGHLQVDASKAQHVLDWKPPKTLSQTLRDMELLETRP